MLVVVDKQLETIVHATSRNNIWIGSVRAGKTVASVVAWLDYVYRSPPKGMHAIVGKTSTTVQNNIIYENLRPRLGKHLVEKRSFIEVFGRRVLVFGANDERATDKLMGVTLHSALCDELSTWTPTYFRKLQTRLSPKGARLFGTSNPEGPFHWLREVVDDPKVNSFTLTLEDNPYLDPEYVAEIKHEMEMAGPMFYGRYILGQWVAAEGQIYKFSDCVVEAPEGEPTGSRIVGVDVGYSNPTAFVELQQYSDGKVYATREYFNDPNKGTRHATDAEIGGLNKKDDQELVEDMVRWIGNPMCHIYVDPSAAGFRITLNKNGIMPYGGSRRLNDIRLILRGISTVQQKFSEGTLKIVRPKCPNLIRELGSYSWDEKATEKGLDRPLPVNDHACDALRYAVMGGWKLWQS